MCLGSERPLPADAIDDSVPRRPYEPHPRVIGSATARPLLRSDRERLLSGFFGEVEVTAEADQGSEDIPPLILKDLFEDR
jgi:hypothetical protein